jgi:hypothetical protein
VTTAPSDAAGASAGEPAQFPLVLGLDTFGDVTHDEDDRPLSHTRTIRNLVEQRVLADQVGVDFFGIGEHYTNIELYSTQVIPRVRELLACGKRE